jgi:hypothetical protein
MATFETLPRFERDWKNLTSQQQALFRKVVLEAFVPDLMAPDRPFRAGLRVKGVAAHPGVFEMTWDDDGRATFTYGPNACPASRTSSGSVSELTPLYPAARPVNYPRRWYSGILPATDRLRGQPPNSVRRDVAVQDILAVRAI